MGRLDGKITIVTGSARGTGAEIARLFVREGAVVTLADVLDDRGQAMADELGGGSCFAHLDVTSEDEWEALVAGIRQRHGKLDVLVNNAAVLHLATIDATSVAAFERVMRVNAMGPFLGTRACLQLMRDSGGGSIVNVGSIDSVQGTSLTAAYTASKFAVRGLTKVTALENKRWNIRANCLCPAAGNSEMIPLPVGAEHMTAPLAQSVTGPARVERVPAARGPAAVAPAAVYFASDESALCSGTELVLDAGDSAGMFLDLPDAMFDANLR
jgi:3alpha(or 20beta)-hydroxysteroid dehydrogenase